MRADEGLNARKADDAVSRDQHMESSRHPVHAGCLFMMDRGLGERAQGCRIAPGESPLQFEGTRKHPPSSNGRHTTSILRHCGAKMAQIAGCVPAIKVIRGRVALKPQVASCAACDGDHTTSILRQKAARFGANRGLCACNQGNSAPCGPKTPGRGTRVLRQRPHKSDWKHYFMRRPHPRQSVPATLLEESLKRPAHARGSCGIRID